MARAPYRPVELTEALRPVAAPVDSFIHAQEPPRDNNLQDLARSLSGLGGSLAGLVGARDKKAEEDDAARGEAAAWQANGSGAATGVAEGLIPAQVSPAFMRSFNKTRGQIAGGLLEQQFAAAYNSWDGKSSTDPAAYDAFMSKFLADKFGNTDPDFLRGYLPKVHQMTDNYLQQHIGDASKATMQGALQASAAKDSQAIDAANTAGLASRKGTDYAGVFAEIERNREASLKVGANRDQYDKAIVDTVTAKAIELRDPKVLDFLERQVPGQDYSWSNTPSGREAKQKTIDVLERMGRTSIEADEKKRREEKAEVKDGVTRDTIGWITRHPNDPVPEELLARGEKVDADFRVNAIRWRDTIGKGTQTSDPAEMLSVTTDILNGGGLQRVQRGMAERVFKDPEDLTRAWKLAESMAKDGPALDGIMKSGSAKTILDTIKKRTAGSKDASKYFDDGSVTPEGLQAQLDFRLQLLAWRRDNPSGNEIEQEKAINAIGADILKRITQPEFLGAIEYERGGLREGNTYGASSPASAPGSKPTQPPRPAEPAPASQSGPPAATPGAAPTATNPPAAPLAPTTTGPAIRPEDPGAWFNAEPPETRAYLERRAAEEKKPLSLKVEEVYRKGIATGTIKPPVPSEAPSPPALAAPAMPAPGEKSPHLLQLERSHSRPGAKRVPEDRWSNPFGIFGFRPRAPWWPKPEGTPDDERERRSSNDNPMRAPDGTPVVAASLSGTDGVSDTMRAFDRAAPASQEGTPNPDAVRMVSAAFERAIDGSGRPVGGYSAARLRDDPKAARILDFVAGPESGGNYNAYYSHGGSTKDLSAMTLDQVVAWSGNRGTASSATGRYQFMRDTLRGLKQEMGLSGSERFTPELQDRLALQLLERRGYSEWKAGRLTDAQFANKLALEWASLPNITAQNGRPAGVSAYAGDGLNRSLMRPADVLTALTVPEGGKAGQSSWLGRTMGRLLPGQRRGPQDDRDTRV